MSTSVNIEGAGLLGCVINRGERIVTFYVLIFTVRAKVKLKFFLGYWRKLWRCREKPPYILLCALYLLVFLN